LNPICNDIEIGLKLKREKEAAQSRYMDQPRLIVGIARTKAAFASPRSRRKTKNLAYKNQLINNNS
jgi:hypothetical protein